MRTVTIIPRNRDKPYVEALLKLAISRGWIAGADGHSKDTAGTVVIPSEWQRDSDAFLDVRYERDAALCAALGRSKAKCDWQAVRNGRYAAEVSEENIRRIMQASRADVISVTVSAGRCAYLEKLHVTGDGRVLGFRRLYHDAAAPARLPEQWPHLLLLGPGALRVLRGFKSLEPRFKDLMAFCESRGLEVASVTVGGRAWDLGSSEGLLRYYASRCGDGSVAADDAVDSGIEISPLVSLFGAVAFEPGSRVADDAVVIGPSFIAEGAVVNEGALVREAILGPGVAVPAGGIVDRAVLVTGVSEAASRADTGPARCIEEREASGQYYRAWPLFSYARLGKRLFDVVFSVLALVILGTIFPLVAVAIKLNSKGPVVYSHGRQGRHGRVFKCLKFRTMMSGAEDTQDTLRAINEVDGPQFKIEDDPRVTLVGEFLRTTNLDEIPQFLNVLVGHMSIVGPRPSPDDENQMCPRWREARLSVRPGITGLWQVSRSQERTNDFHEWIYYDVEYVRRLSFWRDLVIVAKTVKVMAKAFGDLFVVRGDVAEQSAR